MKTESELLNEIAIHLSAAAHDARMASNIAVRGRSAGGRMAYVGEAMNEIEDLYNQWIRGEFNSAEDANEHPTGSLASERQQSSQGTRLQPGRVDAGCGRAGPGETGVEGC